jgi:hypothetical protein
MRYSPKYLTLEGFIGVDDMAQVMEIALVEPPKDRTCAY